MSGSQAFAELADIIMTAAASTTPTIILFVIFMSFSFRFCFLFPFYALSTKEEQLLCHLRRKRIRL
jgi:hypothetical protein